jgi:hypothetical protein
MDDTASRLLVLALQGVFELLVPHSLGLAAREVLTAVCLVGVLWLIDKVQEIRERRATARVAQPWRPGPRWLTALSPAAA